MSLRRWISWWDVAILLFAETAADPIPKPPFEEQTSLIRVRYALLFPSFSLLLYFPFLFCYPYTSLEFCLKNGPFLVSCLWIEWEGVLMFHTEPGHWFGPPTIRGVNWSHGLGIGLSLTTNPREGWWSFLLARITLRFNSYWPTPEPRPLIGTRSWWSEMPQTDRKRPQNS